MKAALSALNESKLDRIGEEATRLITSGDFESLHARFGYAIAVGREPVAAIAQDLDSALADVGATGLGDPAKARITSKRFQLNEIGLCGLVECLVPTTNGRFVLLELVLSATGSVGHITLEQVSGAT
jgi:hypothetical protein